MAAADRFIEELERAVSEAVPDSTAFGASVEPAPARFTSVKVWFTDGSGRQRSDIWELHYLAGLVGSDDPGVLARWVADRMASEVQRLTLNCDWGHEWPLWAPGSEFYDALPSDLGISEELTAELRSFYDFWDAHFLFGEGWDEPLNRDQAQAAAERLATRLAAETEGRFAVENGFRYSFA